jgi:hypothetical protein
MALRIARGLFRLWLILSVLWIGGVGVVTWWTWTLPAVPFVNGQIETGSDGKQYRYDATANEWLPVEPPADREVAPRDKPPPSADEVLDADKHWARELAEARRSEILYASAVALVPPAVVLALGSALVWAFRGFR